MASQLNDGRNDLCSVLSIHLTNNMVILGKKNECLVVASDLCGRSECGYKCYGHSLIVGKDGQIILQLNEDESDINYKI